ncbi:MULTISPECIES: cytochrome C oxidase subunit IV family protein [Thermoactinomyces]|jgi:cytochrome aa3 quinol oxidase subunit IV|uniref:cytochrome C oxidase subunit IV family protein n=1 Tax=Thermoactinomyces TaxID=2023 RepID=UPI0007A0656E|nr:MULTISPECIES: cytochrome C oxidase subunit IV family protein [Thermoactinomyces]KYQ85993.1 hypothetical protein AYX07_11355 [Thermoactinomyces sp. AS95]MBI0387825.1 cytochrome C oxidase subunit IV family protein [Thermoactinomyces sp. CICC 24227]QCV55415.1 cytochrome o ubiquinol oxidase subunit IV [Thermoactinomyces vulgaris]
MKKTSSFPWSHVIGFIGSIVLTLLAIGVAVRSPLSMVGTLTVLLVLAALQILIQLVFFMHINEKKGPAYHTIAISLGFVFTFAVIAGSIWVMTFSYF